MKSVRSLLIVFLFFASVILLLACINRDVFVVHAATASHVVISEVQIAGTTATDEFVELYNPTNTIVNLSGWRLTRKTPTEGNLVASISGIIASHGYFLIANPGYTGSVSADLFYSATSSAIAGNNSVLLYSDAGHTLVDKVGMGGASDSETFSIASPSANGSIERKAFSTSTITSMSSGGTDKFFGNGEDTDNNAIDFIVRTVSDPQNSQSPLEIPLTSTPTATPTATPNLTLTATPTLAVSPTPTDTPSPTATPIPTDTQTPTPTDTSTLTPSPTPTLTPMPTLTDTPTPILTDTPSPTPTLMPSPTLTATPTPTVTLTEIPTPSITIIPTIVMSPFPTPTHILHEFPFFHFVCTWNFKTIYIHGVKVPVPLSVTCQVVHKNHSRKDQHPKKKSEGRRGDDERRS